MADNVNQNESSFERSVYKEFFTLIEADDKNIRVRCKLCPPASKQTYSCSRNSTANLKKHLQVSTVHCTLCTVYMLLFYLYFSSRSISKWTNGHQLLAVRLFLFFVIVKIQSVYIRQLGSIILLSIIDSIGTVRMAGMG